MRLALLVLAMVPSAAAAPTSLPRGLCAIENTTYRLVGEENGATMRFVNDPKLARQSKLSAVLRSAETKKTYKFRFAASNGYSTQYLVPVMETAVEGGDEPDGLGFYMFDAQLNPVELPGIGESAPAYLFVPELGKTLWYGFMNADKRERLKTGMWRRAECGQ
jgi:hypothetical protein